MTVMVDEQKLVDQMTLLAAQVRATVTREKAAEIDRLRAPWRAVDDQDWDYILGAIGHGGRDQFWRAVLIEMRAALSSRKGDQT